MTVSPRRDRPSVLHEYGRLLAFLGVIIGLSAGAMVLAAGGTGTQALFVGALGLVVGGVTAGYMYLLLIDLRGGNRPRR